MKNNPDFKVTLFAQSLNDIHLRSHFMGDVEGQGNIQYVKIFSLVAIFIIVIACINFMNLATAVSGQRAKEVGLRKTVGALRPQLIAQFIGESLLLSFISLLLALIIVFIMLPLFNQLANKSISLNLLNIKILLSLLGIATFTGLISGSYPAFFHHSIP
jgi:ABC-type antimicrobial peptide transport system permease subunit